MMDFAVYCMAVSAATLIVLFIALLRGRPRI
jgi:hypothetical protein